MRSLLRCARSLRCALRFLASVLPPPPRLSSVAVSDWRHRTPRHCAVLCTCVSDHLPTSCCPMEFLHPDNVAGRTLLTLVARGSAILSELLRLSDHIPAVFLTGIPGFGPQHAAPPASSSGGKPDKKSEEALHAVDYKYERILLDFKYLKQPEVFDSIIDNDVVRRATQRDMGKRCGVVRCANRFCLLLCSLFLCRRPSIWTRSSARIKWPC